MPLAPGLITRPFSVAGQALSDYPPRQCRCLSRARGKRPTTDSWRHVAKGQDQTSRISLTFRGPIALITTLDLFYFSHVPSPGVPRGPQRPKNGQTQNPPSRLVVNSLSFLELEMIEFGRRDAAMKNSAPETNSKKYLAQSSTSLTLKLDLLISDAAFDQTITGSRAPKINI